MVILRVWRGWVHTDKAVEYIAYVESTGMTEYRDTVGNAGAQLVSRDVGEGLTELLTLSWWTDLEVIRAFAGDDISTAKYYPEDAEYLVDQESTVSHFEVAGRDAAPPP